MRDFYVNYHKQINTFSQDEKVQYIVDNFEQILSNQEDAEKWHENEWLVDSVKTKSNLESRKIVERLKKRIEEMKMLKETGKVTWTTESQRAVNELQKILKNE